MPSNEKQSSESVLVESIRRGEEKAFKKLFDGYYIQLTNFSWRYTRSQTVAEDLVQDLFFELWENRKTWTLYGSLRPFLFRKMKHKCLNYLKHQKVKHTYDWKWIEQVEAANSDKSHNMDEEQLKKFRESLVKAVEELPPRCRMTYELHKQDGLTCSEVAEIMKISPKTVENQMTRALNMLRDKLSHLLPVLLLFMVL